MIQSVDKTITLHRPEDQLPNDNQYVLIHLNISNWGDPHDPDGDRYWRVAKFCRGISKMEREAMPDSHPRKRTQRGCDEQSNNEKPDSWNEFGPSSHFGQNVDLWAELP